MKYILKLFFIVFLILPLAGEEKLISFGVEFENVFDRNLVDKGGKAIITLPMGSITQILEASNENVFSKSNRAFFRCSLRPLTFLSIYGKVGLTNLEWGFTIPNPPGEPGTPPQDIKFKGNVSFIWGAGAKIKIIEIVGFKVELKADYLTYKPDGKFYIMGIEFKEFEEEQFRLQHGGGKVKYTIDTAVNELSAGLLLSKKFGLITPYLGGGYVDMKPKSTLVMEGTPADIGYVKYDMEFNSKMKENVYFIGGMNINLFGPLHLNLALKTKGVSTFSANLNFVF
ncbi:MAG: hypothetical protein N3B16_03330 [Candidatus Aminicenantes bacterium]|nr:hypothetical protein [Candidatus Aminicenantes bacterium]